MTKTETSVPQAVCDIVMVASPKLKFVTGYAEIRYATSPEQCRALRLYLLTAICGNNP
jgi:hypothetical protein